LIRKHVAENTIDVEKLVDASCARTWQISIRLTRLNACVCIRAIFGHQEQFKNFNDLVLERIREDYTLLRQGLVSNDVDRSIRVLDRSLVLTIIACIYSFVRLLTSLSSSKRVVTWQLLLLGHLLHPLCYLQDIWGWRVVGASLRIARIPKR